MSESGENVVKGRGMAKGAAAQQVTLPKWGREKQQKKKQATKHRMLL